MCWGEQTPDPGEEPVPWPTWQTAADTPITVTGDPDWGKAAIDDGVPGVSPVTDTGDTATKLVTVTANKYGTGDAPTISIRGSAASFAMHDGAPAWALYSGPVTEAWRYIQVRLEVPA